MKLSIFHRAFLYVLLVLGVLVVPAASAWAIYEPLSAGRTTLVLDSSFLKALQGDDISLSARAGVKVRGAKVTFPVIGGKLDPTTGQGVVEHDGALVFEAGKSRLPLKDLQLKTTRKWSPFAAKVGGSKLKLATARRLKVTRAGFGEKIVVSKLRLSAKLATRLAKKLDARSLLEPGMPLGRTITTVEPGTIGLARKNKVELSLAPGFQAKLDSLFVAVNPIFPAEHPGPFTLPVLGGALSTDASQGEVETGGALELLQLGGGQIFWHEPLFDLSTQRLSPRSEILPSPPYVGKQDRVNVAALYQITVSALPETRTVSVSSQLSLDSVTASAFNEVFAKPQGREDVFVAGEAVGGFSVVGKGQ